MRILAPKEMMLFNIIQQLHLTIFNILQRRRDKVCEELRCSAGYINISYSVSTSTSEELESLVI